MRGAGLFALPPVCALAVAAALLLCACADRAGDGPSDAATACPALPSSCPADAPTYAKDIAPLIAAKCVPCHSPGQVAAARDFTTYAKFTMWQSTALVQIGRCLMPPDDAGPDQALSPAERTELLQWFVCGSLNN
jgi:hypothetical protein